MNTTRRTFLRLLASVPFLGTAAAVARKPSFDEIKNTYGKMRPKRQGEFWTVETEWISPPQAKKIVMVRLNGDTIGG